VIRPPSRPREADVRGHYDELDPLYRELWGEDLHHGLWEGPGDDATAAVRRLTDRVADAACAGEGDRVCDVGCGYGKMAEALARERGARVTGYTLSATQHEVAAARSSGGGGALEFVRGDWLHAESRPGEYDAVIAVESTAHMEDKEGFYAKAHRELRAGGRLVVCAWSHAEDPGPWQCRHLLVPICREGHLASLLAPSEHLDLCRGKGLRVEEVQDLTPRVRRTWSICLRRAMAALGRRSTWRHLLDVDRRERRFALTVGRIWLAFRTGVLRYLLLAARK
jgi:tocopherol O-methyltransferase